MIDIVIDKDMLDKSDYYYIIPYNDSSINYLSITLFITTIDEIENDKALDKLY